MTSETAAPIAGQTMADPAEFLRLLPHGSRLIGIDAGTKTLGLALSDVFRSIASPLETIQRTRFTADAARLLALIAQFRVAGLVLGFPSNQFGEQEPGDEEEIATFCKLQYDVSFPMFAKIDVNGAKASPLFDWLKSATPGLLGSRAIKWNFTKFLVDRQGNAVRRFAPMTSPARLRSEIEALL